MSRSVQFKFTGLRELEESLRELSADVGKKVLWNAAFHGAEVVRLAIAQEVVAQGLVDEGILQENILKRRDKVDDPMKAAFRIGAHSKRAFYDLYLELGTRKMNAKPFIFPAVERSNDQAQAKIEEVLRRRIATAVRQSAKLRKRSYL